MYGWHANKKGTCALPVKFRAMPEKAKILCFWIKKLFDI